jgi:Family of unknown function (DUF5681)
MSKDKTPDDYEVGYGKPPKNFRFQKGATGNPKGRPKRARGFDAELLRESESFITISVNGKTKRITKGQGIAIQLINKAMTGNLQALQAFAKLNPQARERLALAADTQPNDTWKNLRAEDLSDDQLARFIFEELEKEKKKSEKRTASNQE